MGVRIGCGSVNKPLASPHHAYMYVPPIAATYGFFFFFFSALPPPLAAAAAAAPALPLQVRVEAMVAKGCVNGLIVDVGWGAARGFTHACMPACSRTRT